MNASDPTAAAPIPERARRLDLLAVLLLVWLGALVPSAMLVRSTADAMVARHEQGFVSDRLGGTLVDHAMRVRQGQPLYQEPDATYVPIVYTPGWYYACAAVMSVRGETEAAARTASLLLVGLGACFLVGWLVVKTRGVSWGVMALVLVVAGYSHCRFFYDAPRVDTASSFAVGLATLCALLGRRSTWMGVALGLSLAVAFWCKQSTGLFTAVLLTGLIFDDWRRAFFAGCVCAAALVLSVFLVNHSTDGWFWKLAIELTQHHPITRPRLFETLSSDWLGPLLPTGVTAVVVLAGAVWRRTEGPEGRHLRVLVLALLATLAFTAVSRARTGGTQKTLMPLVLSIAVVIPYGFHVWARAVATPIRAVGVRVLAGICLAWIAWSARFEVAETLPDAESVAQFEEMVADVERLGAEGPVWIAPWGFLTTRMEGQSMRPSVIALNDLIGVRRQRTEYGLPADLEAMLERREFVAVVYPANSEDYHAARLLRRFYRQETKYKIRTGVQKTAKRVALFVPKD